MAIQYDYNCAMADIVGATHGVSIRKLESLRAKGREIHKALQMRRRNGNLGFFREGFRPRLAEVDHGVGALHLDHFRRGSAFAR